ncbi:MAG: hypothetical protein HQ481_10230 [Alphaproteobacteria bacterium]|nr:hypothetical protein [Alphaproteobacteria bacterium]
MAIADVSGAANLATLGLRGANQQVEALGAGVSQLLGAAQEVSANTPTRVGGAAATESRSGGTNTEGGTEDSSLASPTDASRGQNLDILA